MSNNSCTTSEDMTTAAIQTLGTTDRSPKNKSGGMIATAINAIKSVFPLSCIEDRQQLLLPPIKLENPRKPLSKKERLKRKINKRISDKTKQKNRRNK